MKFLDTFYFKFITATVVFMSIILSFVALLKGLLDGRTFGEILGGAFTLQGARTLGTKALDFGYRYLETVKHSVKDENARLDDDALARRADDVASAN